MECLRRSQLIHKWALLCLLRHPDFVRKWSTGGFQYGALGHRMISIGENRRGMVVVPVAEPCANHPHNEFSLFAWALTETLPTEGRPPPSSRGAWQAVQRQSVQAGSQQSVHIMFVVANSSPDSVLEAFRRKSDGRSPAPLASPPGATPLARSCGSSRTEQDCYRDHQTHQQ